MVIWVTLLAVFLTAGCSQGVRKDQETGAGEGSSSAQTRQETTVRGEETTGGGSGSEIGEASEAPFGAAPEMSGGSEGAANDIMEVKFEQGEDFERTIVSFGSEGGPASDVPAWSLSSPEGEGYTRITFPDLESTMDSDGGFGGSILNNFYVVRAPDGGLFLDIYATGAFQYRVTELSDPGRLVVDYRPADVDLSFPIPVQAQRTVLFEPRAGEAVSSPLKVVGYSRNPEASNTIALVDADGNVLAQSTVLANDWLDTWGYFETSLKFSAFEGQATLRAGSESSRDGSFEGVEEPVTYAGGSG
jgi:hypothetical protein